MNELNFFETTKNKKQLNLNFNLNKLLLPIALIFILAFFVIPFIMLNKMTVKLDNEKTSLVNHKNTISNNIAANTPAENPSISMEEQLKLDSIDVIESIESINKVSFELLNTIKSSIPNSLFLNSIDVNNGTILITGYSKSSNTVARFQNNLENSNLISDVFVSDIVKELGSYSFKLTATVGS